MYLDLVRSPGPPLDNVLGQFKSPHRLWIRLGFQDRLWHFGSCQVSRTVRGSDQVTSSITYYATEVRPHEPYLGQVMSEELLTWSRSGHQDHLWVRRRRPAGRPVNRLRWPVSGARSATFLCAVWRLSPTGGRVGPVHREAGSGSSAHVPTGGGGNRGHIEPRDRVGNQFPQLFS